MSLSNKIKSNILWHGSIQAINYSIPLVLVPILLNKIGVINYGYISLALSLVMIFGSLVDFGFNLTGTRTVSLTNTVKGDMLEILDVISARLVILLPVSFIYLGIAFLITPFKNITTVVLLSYPLLIMNSLFPNWYFVGKQQAKTLSLLTLLSRLVYLMGVICFVSTSNDTLYVNLWSAIGWSFSMAISFYFLPKNLLRFSLQNFSIDRAVGRILQNKELSVSVLLTSAHRSLPIIIAGSILTPFNLGIYSIADKVILAICSFFIVLYGSIFPAYCTYLKKQNIIESLYGFFRKILGPILVVILVGSVLFFILGADVLALLSSDLASGDFEMITPILALIPLGLFINLPLSMTFVAAEFYKEYLAYNLVGLIFILISSFVLGRLMGIRGIVLTVLLTELITFIIGAFLIKNRISNNLSKVHG